MPAFSGLWDGTHGEAYADMPKSDALPPAQRGVVRVLMQGRGMHGHVAALGRNAPATIARVDDKLGDLDVNGGYDYANREQDAANKVTMTNTVAGAYDDTEESTGTGGFNVDQSIARPTNATADDMAHTYDTTLRNGYAGDAAGSGSTADAQTEVISDGT